jgi:hypothetical protein
MKKIEFSFQCSEDPMQMEPSNNGTTRHCTNCERHIADFTKMKPAQIGAYLKNTAKPCGFMLPWQLEQVNDYVERISSQKPSLISRVTKVAAIASSPFIFGNTNAQSTNTTYTVEQVAQTEKPLANEIRVKYANGQPLANGKFELFSNEEKISELTSDLNGKIILEHARFVQYDALSLKHELGESFKIKITNDAICFEWKLAVNPSNKKTRFCEFHFESTNRSKLLKNYTMRATQVEFLYYDTNNVQIKRLVKFTSTGGNIKLKWADVEKAEHIMLTVTTQFGPKTVFFKTPEISTEEPNLVSVTYYKRKRHRKPGHYTRHTGGRFKRIHF